MPYSNVEKQREAQRIWARNNPQTVTKNSNKSRQRKAQFVADYKNRPCADCGVQYPSYVMDLDHLPELTKLVKVSTLVSTGASIKRIKEELSKCEVVCANCHRERTNLRKTIPR